MSERFDGKVALLTGAASGIGRACAVRFVADGATVVGADLDEAGLHETARLAAAGGGSFHPARLDVTDRTEGRAVVDRVVAEHGHLDVLGNIAGVTRIHHFLDATEDELELMLAVNTKGPFFLCQAAIPHLLESDGNIVNIASNAGLMGAAYTVAYCASKGGIVQLTKALAVEYEKTSLRINAVAPGGVRTPMTDDIAFPDDVDFDLFQGVMTPRGRSTPEDIAAVVAFVASDEARRMHGAIVSVDDGLVAG